MLASCQPPRDPAEPWRIGADIPDQPLQVVDPFDLVETDSLRVTGVATFWGPFIPEPGADAAWMIDRGDCALVRIHLRTGLRTKQIGRCGAGPGEFQQPGAFALLGDTAAVIWDPSLIRLARMPLKGLGDTITWGADVLKLQEGWPVDIVQVVEADNNAVILAYGLRNGSRDPLDGWFDVQQGTFTARRFPAPKETWATKGQVASPTDSHYFCRTPFGFIMASRWGHEYLAIGRDGTPLWAVFDSLATPPRTVDRNESSLGAQVQMGIWNRAPACGPSIALLRTATLPPPPIREIVFDRGGTLQLWDYDGRLRLDVDLPPSPDSEPLMGLGFWWNDAFWLQDRSSDVPTLRRFEVRKGTGQVVRIR